MKIGRNEQCLCGSGKKYKHCCLLKKDDVEFSNPSNLYRNIQMIMKQRYIKQCIHPNQSECSEKIVKAHSIQNNRILSKLAVNGHLITMGQENIIFMSGQSEGRRNATTFSGFCGYHDKVTFQDIEDVEFTKSNKQLFLFAYRAFSLEYHRKLEQLNVFQKGFAKRPTMTNNEDQMLYYDALSLGLEDNAQTKSFFDEALLNENYGVLNHCIWEIPYEIEFGVTTASGLHYDINGNRINDFYSNDRIKNVFINIFPSQNKSFCLFSWLMVDDEYYKGFAEQFLNLSDEKKRQYLNNFLPITTENIVISPRLWDSWGENIQQSFNALFNLTMIFEESDYKDLIHETPFDLFAVTK